MTSDPAATRLTIRPGSDFVADSGAFFVLVMLRDLASKPDAPEPLKNDWSVIEQWLGSKGRAVTKTDEQKVAQAWRAYIALGIAPSEALRPVFKQLSKTTPEERTKLLADTPPPEVLQVFERLLASTPDRKGKNVPSSAPSESVDPITWLATLSRTKRIFTVAIGAWCAWVVFRTSDTYEFLGVRLREWDDDMFLANLLIPPALIVAAFAAYKWIRRADK